MANALRGLWRLTRFGEYVSFVVVTTLLGAAAGGGWWSWPLVGVLAANWLAVGFAFMFNDVEDAPDDALDPAKARRNPVSAGLLSARTGRIWSFVVAGLALVLYAALGPRPLLAGAACILLGFLYSWRPVRLKAIPLLDLLSHVALLAGLQFLAAYWTFPGGAVGRWLSPAVMVLAFSLYGQLFNELRDLDGDRQAGVTHTASYLGARATHWLMWVSLAIGFSAAFMTLVVERLIPPWVLLLMVALSALLLLARLAWRGRASSAIKLHQAFQKPVEIAAAVALALFFAGPWLAGALGIASLFSNIP